MLWTAYAPAIGLLLLCTSCAGVPRSRLLPGDTPSGSLTLAQLTVRIGRDTIVQDDETYRILLASGIDSAEIRDGSLGLGRVNCCGGPTEGATAVAFYVPDDVLAEAGDIVEVRLGRSSERPGDAGEANRATRVVEKSAMVGRGACRWEPPNPQLWGRVLYCDWMRNQGWVQEGPGGTIYKSWIKKP